MANKGALSKDPTARGSGSRAATGSSRWMRTGAGQYKDQYGNVVKGQQKRPTKDMSQKKTAPAPAPAPTGQTQFTDMTREQQVEQGFEAGGQAYGDIVNRFRNFDPYQMQSQYQPGFQTEMDKARQNVLGTFERRNQEEFQRQQEDVQRQIAERGLDPASPAAQALYKQTNVRQDLARQEAMSAAETAAYGIQEQGFGQAYKTAMAPYEQFQAIQAPYVAGVGAQYQGEQLTQQQQFAKELAALENKYKLQQMRAMPRGGGGGGQPGPTLYERMQAETLGQGYGQQQPNPWANVAQGVAQGVGAGITQGLTRGGS
tara:strand:- start:3273 stop:4217 length:945 start_codon:yes stop_codon:yes gene_type:complete